MVHCVETMNLIFSKNKVNTCYKTLFIIIICGGDGGVFLLLLLHMLKPQNYRCETNLDIVFHS